MLATDSNKKDGLCQMKPLQTTYDPQVSRVCTASTQRKVPRYQRGSLESLGPVLKPLDPHIFTTMAAA